MLLLARYARSAAIFLGFNCSTLTGDHYPLNDRSIGLVNRYLPCYEWTLLRLMINVSGSAQFPFIPSFALSSSYIDKEVIYFTQPNLDPPPQKVFSRPLRDLRARPR